MSTITQMSNARLALAAALDMDDILSIRDKAEAVRVYAKTAGEGLVAQNMAAEIKLRAERKAGELLAVMEKNAGGAKPAAPITGPIVVPVKLEEMGINKNQSSRWQREATVSDEVFESHIADCSKQQHELTQAGLLKLAGAGHVSQSTGENEWYTPIEYISAARDVMGCIDLDPASSKVAQKTVKAKQFFTIAEDGLLKKWKGRVWLNPPYAKGLIERFCETLISQLVSGDVTQAICLVNNATETKWFQAASQHASAMCFPSGRIKFNDKNGTPANSPLQGQAFLYFGDSSTEFCERFSEFGWCAIVTKGNT